MLSVMEEEEDEKEFPPLTKERKIEIKKFESQLSKRTKF